MSRIFGEKDTFAIKISSLADGPKDASPTVNATWTALEIWVEGRNLCEHTHRDRETFHEAIHWPAVFLARWLVRHWGDLFEVQRWPIPVQRRNALEVCRDLDERLLDLADGEDESEEDAFLEVRDRFVAAHSLIAGSGGGVVPDLYFARDGARVSAAWSAERANPDIHFHLSRGEADIPAEMFLEAAVGFVRWNLGQIALVDSEEARQDVSEFRHWLERLDSPDAAFFAFIGYVGLYGPELEATLGREDWESVFGLPENWREQGANFDPSASWPAVVFRSVSPSISADEAWDILKMFHALPENGEGRSRIEALANRIPAISGAKTDYEEGYRLAEALREALGNPAGFLDVEDLLTDLGVEIWEIDLGDAEVDGGSVFSENRGPLILVNQASPRAGTAWGRRMVLAHELGHLLRDRSGGVSLGVLSGPWAPPLMERRANAFAAELLLPRLGVLRTIGRPYAFPAERQFRFLMDEFGVGETTCINHLRNRFRVE